MSPFYIVFCLANKWNHYEIDVLTLHSFHIVQINEALPDRGRNKRFFSDRLFLRSKNIFFAKQKIAPAGAPQAVFHVILRGGSLDWLK